MYNLNRDLLVLLKQDLMSPSDLDHHLKKLHTVLYQTETIENFTRAHEVLHIDRNKIISKPSRIYKMIRNNKIGAFVFLFNKN
jgi:hypothetical protein